MIVLGDFNQRMPRAGAPPVVYQALKCVIERKRLQVATRGFFDPPATDDGEYARVWEVALSSVAASKNSRQFIDHIAHSEDLAPLATRAAEAPSRCLGMFPRREKAGEPLPDHFGVWLDLKKA